MKIDDTEVPEAVIGCWKGLLDKSVEADLAALCKQHKDLWAGFRPGKAPAREVRHRAKVSLGTLPGLPDDFKDLLVRAGLSQSLLCVLSEAALAETAAGCRRRSKSEPPRRLNIEPGVEADVGMVGCG